MKKLTEDNIGGIIIKVGDRMQRKNIIRFKQRDYKIEDTENYLKDWSIEKYGCGPTSIANILVNLG